MRDIEIQNINELQLIKEEDSDGFSSFWNYLELPLFLLITVLAVFVVVLDKDFMLNHPLFLLIIVLFTLQNFISKAISYVLAMGSYFFYLSIKNHDKAIKSWQRQSITAMVTNMLIIFMCGLFSLVEIKHFAEIDLGVTLFLVLVLFVCLIMVLKNITWFVFYKEKQADKFVEVEGQLYRIRDIGLDSLRKNVKGQKGRMVMAKEVDNGAEISVDYHDLIGEKDKKNKNIITGIF